MLKDEIKAMRHQLGITQIDLANALHVNVTTVSRWELGKSFPNPAVTSLLLGYAYTHSLSQHSMASLRKAISLGPQQNAQGGGDLSSQKQSLLVQIIEDAPIVIFVCDKSSHQILYANKATQQLTQMSNDELKESECYQMIMAQNQPCTFCRNKKVQTIRACDDNVYSRQTENILWNDKEAQLSYLIRTDKN